MATIQNFRSAFNGFNREDVVSYIEYINNKNNAQVNQLNTEISALRQEVAELRARPTRDPAMEEELESLRAERAALAQEVAELRAELDGTKADLHAARAAADRPRTESELEAYRRAERAERIAAERVGRLYDQANAVLADATHRADEVAGKVCALADRVVSDMSELQAALVLSKNTLKDAATSMYTIRPAAPQE